MRVHIGECQGGSNQICNFIWADNCWIMPLSEKFVEDRGGRKMGSGNKTGKSVVVGHQCRRGQGRHDDQHKRS